MTAKVVALPLRTDDLAAATRRFLAGDFTPTTRRVYGLTLATLVNDLGEDRDLGSIDASEIEAHINHRYGEAAASTFNRNRATIGSLFAWAVCKHLVQANPVSEIPARKHRTTRIERARSQVMTYEDLKGIWAAPGRSLRDRTLWCLLYDTGARAQEVLDLNVEDLDLAERRAAIVGKGGHAQTIHWATPSARLLPRIIGDRTSGPVFVTERRARQATTAVDLDRTSGQARLSYRRAAEVFKEASGGRTLHEIRHARITHLVSDGIDTALVMAKSRHRSLRSLQRYVHPTDDDVARLTRDTDPASRRRSR